MEWKLWFQGLLLGFSIAAPVGPIGVLCIRRSLAHGWLQGFVCGLGAATADACYGAVAGLGLSVVSAFLVNQQDWLRLTGGIFLLFLGVKTFLTRPPDPASVPGDLAGTGRPGGWGAYAGTFLLTLSNPATILSFTVIFAGFGLASNLSPGGSDLAAIWLVLGVFCGSAVWWMTLSGLVGLFRSRLGPGAMLWVNRLSGVCIALFGVVIVVSGFLQ